MSVLRWQADAAVSMLAGAGEPVLPNPMAIAGTVQEQVGYAPTLENGRVERAEATDNTRQRQGRHDDPSLGTPRGVCMDVSSEPKAGGILT